MAFTRKCPWPQIHWVMEIFRPWFWSFISISKLPTLVTHLLPYLQFHLVWTSPLPFVFSLMTSSYALPPCPGIPQKCSGFLKCSHWLFYDSSHPYWNCISGGNTTSLTNFPNEHFLFSFLLPHSWFTQSPKAQVTFDLYWTSVFSVIRFWFKK